MFKFFVTAHTDADTTDYLLPIYYTIYIMKVKSICKVFYKVFEILSNVFVFKYFSKHLTPCLINI